MERQFSDKDLEWTDQSKEILLKTPIATVCQTNSSSSEGLKNRYITIDSRDWVIVIPVKGDKFMMVKQWRHGEKRLTVEFPGGVIDDGESPEESARRELKEETGCTSDKLVYLGKMNPNPAFMTNHVHFFAAFDLKETGLQDLDEDEYLNYMEMSKKDVYQKIGCDQMPHALMASALLLYRQAEDANKF